MSKVKKGLIILLIILVILVAVIIFIMANKNDEQEGTGIVAGEATQEEDFSSDVEVVTDEATNKTIQACISKYVNVIYACLNESYQNSIQARDRENIYNMLAEKYIAEKGITNENVLNFVHKIDSLDFEIKEILVKQDIVIQTYGVLLEINNGMNVYLVIMIDSTNNTFAIDPLLNKTYNNTRELNLEANQELEIVPNTINRVIYSENI
jgi:hypothetical protein